MSFNLLDEGWIPVLYTNGKFERIGIRKALTQAGHIRQIAASNPMDNVALLRFLLAVLMWCKPELSDDERSMLGKATGIPEDWLSEKLGAAAQPNAVFNLLGDGKRFMQAPGCAHNDRPVADLYHELPGDSNKAHFRHIRDYREGMCPGCVTIGLARLPVAITGKGSGKRPGINGDPPCYFVPVGKTLLRTFAINWQLSTVAGDQPCWLGGEQPTVDQVGTMEGFTWTSRQFRIADEDLNSGICMVCGTATASQITRLKELNGPNGRDGLSRSKSERWRDPHLLYDSEGKAWAAQDAEKNLPESSGQWRDWLARLESNNCNDLQPPQAVASAMAISNDPLFVMVAGIAMQGSDKPLEAWGDWASVPKSNGEVAKSLTALDDVVSGFLDPRVTLKGKKLARFKDKHPLRVIRNFPRDKNISLSDAIRVAMAERLPVIELAMSTSIRTKSGVGAGTPREVSDGTNWRSAVTDIAKTSTPGSPLRRREAMARARLALESALNKATAAPNSAPREQGASDTDAAKASKPKRSRKKKGGDA